MNDEPGRAIERRVVAQFDRMLGADGGRLEVIDHSDTMLRVRYIVGPDSCQGCAFDPNDLGKMISESLLRNGSRIGAVEVQLV